MFRGLWLKLKEVMYQMGIIKGLSSVSKHRKLNLLDEHYDHISKWKSLYQGYLGELHDYYESSISGGRQKKRRLTLNMPKVATSELAGLIFNEKCSINIGENDKLKAFVEATLKQNRFTVEFQRFLEYGFALGGLAIKVYLRPDGRLGLNFVSADSFIPVSWDNAGISEAVFVDKQIRGKYQYTHLEWHTWEGVNYVVFHEVFRSDKDSADLGIKVGVKDLYPDLQERTALVGLERPLFTYIKPNTANNLSLDSPLGLSVFHQSLDTLRALDTAYDSFEREFRLGRKRILVPSSAIRTVVTPDGKFVRYFDATDETYEAFHTGEDATLQDIKDISVSLRVEEHIQAINALLNLFSMQLGFSAGTFSFDVAGGIKTATEVVAENSKTFRTKQAHETVIEAALVELVDIMVQFAQLYELADVGEGYEVTVTFDDSIAQDRNQDAQYYISLVTAGLLSKQRAIVKTLGVTEDEAAEILAEIKQESVSVVNEAVDLFGLGGDG